MKNKVFIIAEAGVNHNGKLDLAYKLIDKAAEANVDAIKFQTFTAENLVTKSAPLAKYQKKNLKIKNQYELLKKLGAKNIVNRSEFEGETKLLGKAIWDGVVDTVGGNILAHAISQTKHSGIVAACGNAGGIKLNTNVLPFILRGVKLWGIDSIQVSMKRRQFVWSQVERLVDFKVLEEIIQVISMEELINTFPKMLKGQTSGRIVVDVNK